MNFDDEDPEVAADRIARTYPSREGTSDEAFERSIRTTAIVNKLGTVPCRSRCGGVVDWTQEAEDMFQGFCRQLAAKREAPLDKTRIVFCNTCRARGRIEAGAANREHVNRLADVIRKLKASSNPDGERELLEQARKYSHPDVSGLLEALRSSSTGNSSRKARKAGGM